MPDQENTRRKILVAAITYSGLTASGLGTAMLSAGTAWAQSSEATTNDAAAMLARMARLLYPHAGIGDDMYLAVIESILTQTASDPAMTKTLDAAIHALNAAPGGDWFEVTTEQQLAALQAVEKEPFFGLIQAAVRDRFYNHAVVWKHIGYPGSSVEHGGYLERGFDDIDWLPEDA